MGPEEYPELIADPYAFIVEKMMPRRASELAKPFPRNELALAKGALLFGQYLERLGAAFKRWEQVYGAPLAVCGFSKAPIDMIEDQMRGFRGMTLDIKRRPEEVKAACEAMLPLAIRLAKASFGGPPADYPPLFIPLHIATFLRPVDFEEFYWPTFRKLIEVLAEAGFTCLLYAEGNWEPYLHFLAQLPKGRVIAVMEYVDMKRAKAVLGDTMCLGGSIPVALLGYGSEDEVIAYAKDLIDAGAPGGGFILSAGKVLLSPNDARPENLMAVTKFVKEYGVYSK
ncbi:MAG: uroporphyrinogen decarboxylase family protein, partial [Nitrospinota bacterium]